MARQDEKIIAPYPFHVSGKRIEFQLPGQKLSLPALNGFVQDILSLTNGSFTKKELLERIGRMPAGRKGIRCLEEMLRHGAICGADSLAENLASFWRNPSVLFSDIGEKRSRRAVDSARKRQSRDIGGRICPISVSSSLDMALLGRRSSRAFKKRKVIKEDDIFSLIWAGYGITEEREKISRHTAPSAGALYPLCLNLVLFGNIGSLRTGVYDISFPGSRQVQLSRSRPNIDGLEKCFASLQFYSEAAGMIVVSGSLAVCSEKYSVRSLLFVPLEAGHVAQNILLKAQDKGLSTLEVGAFLEGPLERVLRCPKGYHPLTVIFFGCEDKITD